MSYQNLSLGGDNSIYLKLPDGQSKIRIVGVAIPVWTEFDRVAKTAHKYLDEKLAAGHPEAKRRYAFWCIDRADGKFKMAEFGVSIMKQIQLLSMDSDYGFDGDIAPYDIKILREGSGMETSYSVTPSPITELTAEEKAKIVGLEHPFEFFKKQPGVIAEEKPAESPPSSTDIPF